MNKVVKRILVLVIVGIFSGFVLAWTYNYAKPKIEENKQEAVKKAINDIFSSVENYEVKKIMGKEIHFCYNSAGKLLGYAFETSGMGYQGEIVIMVGLNKDLKTLKGIEILKHSETPGLGAKIVKEKFKKQFKNLKIHPSIQYTTEPPKKNNQIQAITGATVTSSSMVEILNRSLEDTRKKIENYYEKK